MISQRHDPRRKRFFFAVAAAVAMELDVRQVPAMALQSFMVSSVVVQLPGRPRLLEWMCAECGTFQLVDRLGDRSPGRSTSSKLPHPVHIHANNLGLPGNWTTTLETMKLLEGHRGHLTHIQFHSYGGGAGDEDTFSSRVAPLADYVNAHPNLTVDVGQVVFGETTSMTADGPVGYYLSKVYKSKWFSNDTELETGCGIVPIEYKNTSLIHAWQWAIGLEWYLMVDDPWRVVMSTDHPNGGSFLAYPQIIRLLMDRTYRAGHAQDRARRKCASRRASPTSIASTRLSEIAIITRAGPGADPGPDEQRPPRPGADADVTIYTPDANQETMFSLPALRHQGGPDHCRARRNPRGVFRQDAARRARLRSGRRDRHQAAGSNDLTRSGGGTIRSK